MDGRTSTCISEEPVICLRLMGGSERCVSALEEGRTMGPPSLMPLSDA